MKWKHVYMLLTRFQAISAKGVYVFKKGAKIPQFELQKFWNLSADILYTRFFNVSSYEELVLLGQLQQ